MLVRSSHLVRQATGLRIPSQVRFQSINAATSSSSNSSSTTTTSTGVQKLAVIGAGQMGAGIALVAASDAKVPVLLVDLHEAVLHKALKFLDLLLEKNVKKGKISGLDAQDIKSRITTSSSYDGLTETDFVIEAVPEIEQLKLSIFSEISTIAPANAVLSTNTSSISVTRIAASAKGAEHRVVSTHFMNPVPVQKGVEIISGLQTSSDTLQRAIEFVRKMGKSPSVCEDAPGFMANRILLPYINEAIICLETGIGKREDIDNIMKNGCAMPMGPLALADFIGLDTCLAIMKLLHTQTGDSKYRPAILLQKMVDAGWHGKKTRKGFYDY
ncbi:3-hydroxyacyl-CoA dehydrogenase [Lipomyces japonicus]|uniref:3-hydroxyacyl-CoA dehydrogenase n=1 Tax=Lipomyces japonicus TaxID=56871 RepID=UPI0034CEE353